MKTAKGEAHPTAGRVESLIDREVRWQFLASREFRIVDTLGLIT